MDIELIEKESYLYFGDFFYSNGNIRLNNWLDGEINGVKVKMYWWDGIPFLPNNIKPVTISSPVQLQFINLTELKVESKIVGEFNFKSHRIFKYYLPNF